MRMRIALAGLALVLVASLGGVSTAGAAPKGESVARVIGKVKTNDDGTATVKAQYVCPAGDNWHLWVSAKQVEGGERNPALEEEGSSQISDAWLQSHPGRFTCNGKWQTDKFKIDTEEQGFGELERGEAWVQFCVIDEAAGAIIVDQRWAKVR